VRGNEEQKVREETKGLRGHSGFQVETGRHKKGRRGNGAKKVCKKKTDDAKYESVKEVIGRDDEQMGKTPVEPGGPRR